MKIHEKISFGYLALFAVIAFSIAWGVRAFNELPDVIVSTDTITQAEEPVENHTSDLSRWEVEKMTVSSNKLSEVFTLPDRYRNFCVAVKNNCVDVHVKGYEGVWDVVCPIHTLSLANISYNCPKEDYTSPYKRTPSREFQFIARKGGANATVLFYYW